MRTQYSKYNLQEINTENWFYVINIYTYNKNSIQFQKASFIII